MKTDEKLLEIGVVGMGKMGLVHAAIIGGLKGSRVAAAADPAPAARRVLKQLNGSIELFEDVESMLSSAELDAVVLATPVAYHVPGAMACVQRRIPFFLEKPLAVHGSQAEELVREAEARSVPHMIGYATRFTDSFAKAKTLIDSRCLGKLQRVRATMYVSQLFGRGRGWRYERDVSGGGVLLSQGSHLLDLLTWYLGPVTSVNAQAGPIYSKEIDDFAHLVLEFESGLLGWMDCSWSVRFHRTIETTIDLQGEKGSLIVSDDSVRVFLERPSSGLPEGWSNWTAPDLYRGVEVDIAGTQYTREIVAFLESVRTGRTSDIDLRSALHVQRIVDAAYDSATASGAPREVLA